MLIATPGKEWYQLAWCGHVRAGAAGQPVTERKQQEGRGEVALVRTWARFQNGGTGKEDRIYVYQRARSVKEQIDEQYNNRNEKIH